MSRHGIASFGAIFSLGLWFVGWSGPTARAQEADDPAEARVMERFLGVLEKTPRRGTALDRVYGYHVERGSLDALVKRYEDRTRKDPGDGEGWMLLGLVEAQRGRDASAVAAFREAERLRPGNPLAPYYLGQALVLVGQPDTAVDAFERALTRRPQRVDLLEIYQSLGRVHQRARRSDKALAVWARLEATFPDDARVREQIAAALAEEDQPAQALARYEALARDVKDEYRKVQFALESAELKVRLGRSPEALADFEKLLGKLDPGSWLFKEVRRKIEDVFLRGDDLAGLAKYYEGWIARTPDDVDAMARLGRAYAQLGRAADSRGWLDKAVGLAPSRRDLRLALIEQLGQEKKFAEASAQYEALVKAEPNNPDLVRDWGRLLLRDASKPEADRKAAASAVWKRLAGPEVKDAVTVAQAADLYRQAEMVDDAIALYRRAIALSPDSAQYREYLGEYYHQLKRPADALATWTAAPAKSAAEKGRLGEVLAGFGYRKEALDPFVRAVKLAPDDFDLRVKLADLLVALDRPRDALAELAVATRLADAPERAEAALAREIAAYQAAKILGERVAALKGELDAGLDPNADRWTRLARYFEADGKPAEAIASAERATAADPKSIVAWSTLGRLQEASGNLASAADANRKLAALDRRNRAEYLSAIARLEARLGRTGEALKAGRELLAAAPGNAERHQEFAELCFNLGEVDEGLDALRRASRANPSDPKASNTLADALARQFRTEEAIELYWRAFDRTKELDARLAVVARLADQYIQRNQFDRVIARLERELREPERKRELALCLAQAYQAAGDLGTARQQLESLLSANPRDSALLVQLSNLAEAEGDVSAASRYLKVAVDIAPTPEGTARLGNLYLRAGETAEAEAVWARLASADQDASRAFAAIDSLLAAGKNETVLTLTERLLLKRPDDWDALYREGVALNNLEKPAEAARRFRQILDLKAGDDDVAAIPKSRKRGGTTGPSGVAGARMSAFYQYPLHQRMSAVYQLRSLTRLDTQRFYSTGTNTIWAPADFGQSRMAALAWLYAGSLKEPDPEAWANARKAEAEQPGADPRRLWDLYYLALVRANPRETYPAAVRLSRAQPNDPAAQYALLSAVAGRDSDPATNTVVRMGNASNAAKVDKTPPLPRAEQALLLEAFEGLRRRRPDLIQSTILANVTTELKRAKREPEADALARSAIDGAGTLEAVASVLPLAAERGDVDGLIALIERHERLASASASNSPPASFNNAPVAQAVARAMGVKAEAKDYPAILRLLDRVLASAARPDQVARRLKAKNAAVAANSNYFMIYTSKAQSNRYTTIDFPSPNPFFDYGSIYALRNAFEVYKKGDLASDLIARFRAEAAKAPDDAKVYPTLATSYLLWWNDEKDEALKEYNRATELSRNDVELKLSLAELRAQRGEPAEALEAADSVEPLDQKTMQRREILALRLSVLAGDVDRARKASERLFGLRLDGETQVQLATQMNQLGMHELSEAVLARARRRSGGNAQALVALMLQYQRQGKADVAVQVANQILRQTSGARQAQPGSITAADQSRTQAVQVFARSGKLKELIARAEAQLATSPTSLQLLQTLVDYYQADGQRDKVKATYEKIARVRPDDARLRFQIGLQLSQAGAAADALDHFRAALKKEPALFANQYFQVQQAFQQAGKADELVKLYEAMDFKSFRTNPYIIQNTIQNLFQNDQTRDQGLALLRKAWKDLPEARASFLGAIHNDRVWQLPEIYEYAREAIIPPANRPLLNPWAGMDEVNSWAGDGAVTNVMTQVIEASNRQGKLDALALEVAEAVKRTPEWLGGKALLAVLKARRGKVDEARLELEPLAAKGVAIPMYARMVIAQEVDKVESLRDVELKLLEAALADNAEEIRSNGNGFQLDPRRRLALLYKKVGRPEAARDLVLAAARSGPDSSMYDASYAAYQKLNQSIAIGSMLFDLGYPADSARFYSEVANDTQGLEAARQMYSGGQDPFAGQIAQGLERSLQGMNRDTLARTLRTILTPKGDAQPGEPRLDLVLLCHPRELDKAGVFCLFEASIKALKGDKDLDAEVRDAIDRLVASHPDDLSVLAASALYAGLDGKGASIAGPAERMARLLDARPLDPVPAGGRANARQREEAARQLPAWVVARACSEHDETRSIGDKLAARGLEAARRQLDNRWSLAMLREAGQSALDRGDRPAAEAAWRGMLRVVLAPTAAPKPATTAAPTAPARPAATPTPTIARPAAAGPAVITLERFEQVVQLARLAADRDLARFSIDAVREALAGGPPVTPIAVGNPNGRVIRRGVGDAQVDPVARKVEEQLFVMDATWARGKADPVAVYEVLRDAVLPGARAGEVFLYPRPLAMAPLRSPRSVGALLARWTVRAGRSDELRAAIEARQSSPLAAAPARVLLAQLEWERKDYPAENRALDAIREGVAKGSLAVTGEQACLAALPALEARESAEAAARVVESSIPRVASTDGEEPVAGLLVRLARHELASDRAVDARKHLREFQDRAQQSTVRYGGDYALFRRRSQLARAAGEFARAGLLDDALDQMGQYADAPVSADYGDGSDISNAFAQAARLVAALPPEERYLRLKSWALPTPERKSVRWSFLRVSDPRPPSPFEGPKAVADRGIAGFTPMLIEAARATGRLDALAAEVRPLADSKVENAARLLAHLDLARGVVPDALPRLRSRLDELKQKAPSPDPRFNRGPAPDPADYRLAREALASPDPAINAVGEELAATLIEQTQGAFNTWFVGQSRRDLARYRARRAGAPAEADAHDPGLAWWSPRYATLYKPEAGRERALWAESAGVVGHASGPGPIDVLMFRYPLAGTFEFSVDAHAEASVGYGGLFADPVALNYPSGVHSLGYGQVVARPGTFARAGAFNRITIRTEPGKVSYLVNNHLFYEDAKPGGTSPWLALGAGGPRQAAFRNPTLAGRPEIPREVALSGLDSLDGWDQSGFGDTVPNRRGAGLDPFGRRPNAPSKPEDFDWHAADGEIRGRRLDPAAGANVDTSNSFTPVSNLDSPVGPQVVQSRLAYLRPLGDGESIAYEFFYQPGETMVHPAVGHLAFLVEPDGVRLHALVAATEGPGEPGPGNVLDDPAGRRGAFALKPGAWNSAVVRLKGATVAVEINGQLAHERALDADDDRIFSLYHDKASTAARARNVVLRGDWPKELGPDAAGNLFARREPEGDRSARRARAAIVDEPTLLLSAGNVARGARKLPPAERYARLLGWVLPGDDHASTRLAAEFGPTDGQAPPTGPSGPGSRVAAPPALDSPALDLVASAAEVGKLDDLAEAVAKAEAPTPTDRRGRLALLALVEEARGKVPEAVAALDELRALAKPSIAKQTPDWQRWPELIAGSALAARPGTNAAATALLDEVVEVIQRDFHVGPLELPIRHARAVARSLAHPDPDLRPGDAPRDRGWIHAALGTADTKGRGLPWPTWAYRDGAWLHAPGHHFDMLFLATPLRGDFEVTCDLTAFGWREARLSYAGTSIGLNFSWKEYEVQHYGRADGPNVAIDPPLKEGGDWYPFRLVVKDGRMTTFAQGRKLDERPVGGEGDPWLAIFASGRLTTGVRNLKVGGSPAIPDRLHLSASSDLAGWLGDYYDEPTRGDDATWQKRGEEIVGRRLRVEPESAMSDAYGNQQGKAAETVAGSKHESILRYARPLAEDGEVAYEFFHDPGRAMVHPALDRLAFVLEPDGVKVHRVTDGKHDRTGLDPGNLLDEPASRRGPPRLPLKPGAWNALRMTLRGDEVTLSLNGEDVFARKLEPTNGRDLGLFYFADQGEGRVRNVEYRGDWPKALPADLVAPPEK